MADQPKRDRVFISYSHADAKHLMRLQKHLKYYERKGLVDSWDDTKLEPGSKWRDHIKEALSRAKVGILLVSADFLASDFIAENELPPLLAAAEDEGATILIVVVNSCAFEDTDLAQYQAINGPSRPMEELSKPKREAVWTNVARRVRDVLAAKPQETPALPVGDEALQLPAPAAGTLTDSDAHGKQPDAYLNALRTDPNAPAKESSQESIDDLISRGVALNSRKQFEKAELVLQHAVKLAPDSAAAWVALGVANDGLKEWDDALRAYRRALAIEPEDLMTLIRMTRVLSELNRHEEGLAAANRAIEMDPHNGDAYMAKSSLLIALKRHDEALATVDHGLTLKPSNAGLLTLKSLILWYQDRYKQALDIANAAVQSNEDFVAAWHAKSLALRSLKLNKEAQEADERAQQIMARRSST